MSKMHQEGNSHFFVLYFYIYLQDAEQWEDRSCVGKTRIYANQLHIYISENFLLVIDEFCILILHKQTVTADILCFQILFLAIIKNIMFWISFNNNIYALCIYIFITHISYYSFIYILFKFCFSLPCHTFKTVLNTKWNRKNKSVITKEIKQDREGVCGGLSQDRWEMQFFSIFDERYLNSRMKSVFIVWGVKLWVANV